MINPSNYNWLWRTLQDESQWESGFSKWYVGAVTHLCNIVDVTKLMWSELALLLGKKLAHG